jgi:LPPG:FO 2-phospho-L-lactate transferase
MTVRVVGLGGGIGAARLWRALATTDVQLSLIVNTADDMWHLGLRICPDLDTVLYALSGRQDTERGWGVRGETWRCMDALRELDVDADDVWFNLGDTDLATHLYRTSALRRGIGLGALTGRLAAVMGVRARVLPMTEAEVATMITTEDGESLHYEQYLVRHGGDVPVRGVEYAGVVDAAPAPGVLEAIDTADVIVLGPSNPVASVLPILALPGVREAMARRRDRVVAVSPIVSGVPVDDDGERRRARSRAALLAARGVQASAAGVAGLYAGVCGRFVVDPADAAECDAVEDHGLVARTAGTLLHRDAVPGPLLDTLLAPADIIGVGMSGQQSGWSST